VTGSLVPWVAWALLDSYSDCEVVDIVELSRYLDVFHDGGLYPIMLLFNCGLQADVACEDSVVDIILTTTRRKPRDP
jgi:hypothetical protein